MTPELEQLAALPPMQKAQVRKAVRRRMTEARRMLMRPLAAEQRAWLTGFMDEAYRALAVLAP